jgi:hypothetical protein
VEVVGGNVDKKRLKEIILEQKDYLRQLNLDPITPISQLYGEVNRSFDIILHHVKYLRENKKKKKELIK